MTKDDLARAVVGLPGFRYRSGMGKGHARVLTDTASEWESVHLAWNEQAGVFPDAAGTDRVDLDDAATGGVLLAMVPPEHRHRVQWREGWANWAWLGPAAEFPHKHRLWQPADSQGHAAALVLVDCGRCHGG